jgi:tungstate transport system ATP-binding protein
MTDMREASSILPLSVEDICFAVDGRKLLDGVRFTLPKGGITAVIGPNGAGKSLLLRLSHGLISPTAGRVRWQVETPRELPKRHAMVFQRPVMLRRSALANVAHALAATGSADAAGGAARALERFGLGALADRPARHLSGGEQQRLAIARAWALGPELLFLDEPTSQLDPGATRQIEEIIEGLAGEGMTVLMATHDLGQAKRLSQRVLFLNKGQLIEDRSTADFFSAPMTPEARRFISGDLVW